MNSHREFISRKLVSISKGRTLGPHPRPFSQREKGDRVRQFIRAVARPSGRAYKPKRTTEPSLTVGLMPRSSNPIPDQYPQFLAVLLVMVQLGLPELSIVVVRKQPSSSSAISWTVDSLHVTLTFWLLPALIAPL